MKIARLLFVGLLIAGALAPLPAFGAGCPVSPGPTIDVTTCPTPAVPDDNADDTAAINQAITQMHGLNGGRVYFPPGTYDAAGITQKSGVELNGPATARLKRRTGPVSLVVGEVTEHVGDAASGSSQLTGVAKPKSFEPGATVAVRGGAGGSDAQWTTLSAPVPLETSPVVLTNGRGFPSYAGFLLIDNEIIKYRSQPGSRNARLSGVERGKFGTSVAPHGSGTVVRLLQRLYARVVSVSGSTVTLDRPVGRRLVNTAVSVGSMNMSVTGLSLDGNAGEATVNTYPLDYELARNVVVRGARLVRGEHGGIRLARGTSGAVLEDNTLLDNGDPADRLGSAIWLFQHAEDNIVRNNRIGDQNDRSFLGVTADDRSDKASEWDGPSNGNKIEANRVMIPRMDGNDNGGIVIQGSSGNTVSANEISRSLDGIRVHDSRQGSNPLPSFQNTVANNRLIQNDSYAISVTGRQNTIRDNEILESGSNCKDATGSPPENTWSGNTTDDGSRCPGDAPT